MISNNAFNTQIDGQRHPFENQTDQTTAVPVLPVGIDSTMNRNDCYPISCVRNPVKQNTMCVNTTETGTLSVQGVLTATTTGNGTITVDVTVPYGHQYVLFGCALSKSTGTYDVSSSTLTIVQKNTDEFDLTVNGATTTQIITLYSYPIYVNAGDIIRASFVIANHAVGGKCKLRAYIYDRLV